MMNPMPPDALNGLGTFKQVTMVPHLLKVACALGE
jgi:hypothetical protein